MGTLGGGDRDAEIDTDDAGRGVDAGTAAPDAASPDDDAGAGHDAGDSMEDAGPPGVDAGPPDSGAPDAGPPSGCPASGPVHVERWMTEPWNAPASGDAEQVIRLSTENQRHYARAVITFEMETGASIPGEWTHVGVFRNQAIPGSWPHLAWYGWLLSRHNGPRQIELALNGCQNGGTHTLQPNTVYQVTYDYDAVAGTATFSLDWGASEHVGATCPATSSLVPIGNGLHFYLGMRTSHSDYPVVQPPSGFTFRRFVADLTPGGPFGDEAPPCP